MKWEKVWGDVCHWVKKFMVMFISFIVWRLSCNEENALKLYCDLRKKNSEFQ